MEDRLRETRELLGAMAVFCILMKAMVTRIHTLI